MRRALFLTLLFSTQWTSAAQDLPSMQAPGLKDPKEIINLQLKSLDHLRSMTKRTVANIDELSSAIVKYQMVQNLFLQNPKDKEILQRMTKMAFYLLRDIKKANLQHAIDPDFTKELKLFAKIYQKNELPIE